MVEFVNRLILPKLLPLALIQLCQARFSLSVLKVQLKL